MSDGNDNRQHRMKAETGHFNVIPGNVELKFIPFAGPVANVANLAMSAFTSPLTTTVIEPAEPKQVEPIKPGSIISGPNYNVLLLFVFGLTVVTGAAQLMLALALGEHPTPMQQQAFAAMNFAWQAGLGAILGLLGGKAINQ
jgi:hypothetical protein